MKYSSTNPPLVCMQKDSLCYKGTSTMKPKGILWHSTGANNTKISRYVQPSITDPNYNYLITKIGKNTRQNDWNHIPMQAGLNCWIGQLADGSVTTIQTMPWNFKPWGCSGGRNGSCNDGWIQFEICEDNLCNPDYFDKVYWEACELTAYLCKLYNIDPMGTVKHNGVTVPTILCHQDSFRLGLGSNHGDIYHWFPRYGKSMETVREDVSRLLRGEAEVTQEQFNQMMDNYLIDLAKKEPSDWSQESRAYAESTGLIKGGKDGSKMYKKFVTREELVAVIYRLIKNGGI